MSLSAAGVNVTVLVLLKMIFDPAVRKIRRRFVGLEFNCVSEISAGAQLVELCCCAFDRHVFSKVCLS